MERIGSRVENMEIFWFVLKLTTLATLGIGLGFEIGIWSKRREKRNK